MKRRKFLTTAAITAGAAMTAGLRNKVSAGGKARNVGDILQHPEQLKGWILDEARRIFNLNKINSKLGTFHLPSKSSYPRFFGWDSGWNIISQSAFDQEGSLAELEAVYNFQADSGMVAHEALIPELDKNKDPTYLWLGDKYFDAQGRCRIIDPPSFLVAAEVLYSKTKSPRVLALLPKVEKCLEYLIGPRDLFEDGLVSIIHPWEAGTDATPAFNQITGLNPNNPFSVLHLAKTQTKIVNDCAGQGWDLKKIAAMNEFVFEDLCMNSLTAAGAVSVSKLFAAAGQESKAQKWMARAKDMTAAMEKIFWDNERGIFYPRWDLQKKITARRVSVPSMLPLLTGLVSEDKAQRVLNNYLMNPDQFWGPWLVPFNSISEMEKENTMFVKGELWRGPCIWINMNWMAARMAVKYGRKSIAETITLKTAALIGRNGFREFYNPANGEGMGAKNFTWPALVLDMIEEHGL